MKVHIKQIPAEGLQLEGADDPIILELREPDVTPASPIRYQVEVGLSDGGLFATGQLACEIDLRCVNCLDHFQFPIRIENFACQIELTGAEMVDLTPLVREDILLALPAHPHCDWDGNKQCQPPFSASSSASDSSSQPREVWGPLDQLNIKPNN